MSLKENLSNVTVQDEQQDEEAVWSEVKAALSQRRLKKKMAMLGEMAQDETTNDATLLKQQVQASVIWL